ncbi:hypothetical protein [Acidocella sp.]|jgi:ElaB/YqjD/DUF883 family membrane-anchored ribosome-binding protein|uniref:hypothetical protein n=1 Tax=Acidocella sp. TaxID=50710 RepID=UPI00262CCD15|nr:hypothetical protein [Acidocella sp.]
MRSKRLDPSAIDVDQLKREFEKIREQLGEAAGKLGGNAHSILDQINDYLHSESLSSRVSFLEEEFGALGAKLKGTGKDAVAKLESEVSAKPLTALAVAFGVGLVASAFMRRS